MVNDRSREFPRRILVWIYGHSEGLGGQPATDSDDFPSGADRAAVRILNSTSEEDGDMITSIEGRRTPERIGALYALVQFRYEGRKSSDSEVQIVQSLISVCHSLRDIESDSQNGVCWKVVQFIRSVEL